MSFTPSSLHNRRILEFAILCLCLTFLRIYPSQSQDPRINKNSAEKIENVIRALKKSLNCGQDKSPGQVDRHQATGPSRSIDLGGRLAVWMRLKEVMSAFSFTFEATQFVEMADAAFLCIPCDLVYGHRTSFLQRKKKGYLGRILTGQEDVKQRTEEKSSPFNCLF